MIHKISKFTKLKQNAVDSKIEILFYYFFLWNNLYFFQLEQMSVKSFIVIKWSLP